MRVTVSNTICIENPSSDLIAWCKEYLTISNPEYAKKVRMHFWLGNTPKTLNLYEIHGDDLVLPFGCLRELLKITDINLISDFSKPVEVEYRCEMALYDYQQVAVGEMCRAHYGILQAPAGSGKTEVGIALVNRIGRRALWLCTTHDLLTQGKARAERYMPKHLIGTITGGQVCLGEGITFATIQTMCKLDLGQYKDYWDVIIVDECHRCSGSPTTMTQFYKVLNSLSARHKYGLSATVHRSDGMIEATYALLGHVVHSVPDDAVADKIMRVGIRAIGTNTKLGSKCLNTDGTLNYTSLISYLCSDVERNQILCTCLQAEEDRSCLILSDRLEHLETLMGLLPLPMRIRAVMITGKMTSKKGKAEREQAIEDMRQGRMKYLFATYSLCKEGLDIPRLERLFMTTPVKDYTVVVQSIGRIARTFEGKSSPIAYDFVDNIGYLVKAYKQRCRHYRKAGAYFCEEPTE